jgi:hypothetical protein
MNRYIKYFKEDEPTKTKSVSKVLQLMDKDVPYLKAVLQVVDEDKISREQLEKELEPFI